MKSYEEHDEKTINGFVQIVYSFEGPCSDYIPTRIDFDLTFMPLSRLQISIWIYVVISISIINLNNMYV